MTLNKRKSIILAVVLIIIGTVTFVWVRSFVFSNMGLSINKKIQSLELSGFNVRYDSISIDWIRSTIEIDRLLLEKNPYDTACLYPEFIAVEKVRAEGFRLFPLIFRNILSFESLFLDGPRVIMRQNSLLKLDSTSQRENEFTVKIDKVLFKDGDFTYTDSVHCKMITGFKSDLSIDELEMDFHVDRPFEYHAKWLTLDSSQVKMPLELYTFQIQKAKFDFENKFFQADSIRILPDLGRIEFGRKHGSEIDRFEGLIPFVKLNDFSLSFADSTMAQAKMAEVQFYLKIFRDKRLPFVREIKLLPMEQIAELPFGLIIDSLKVTKSYVQYEELVDNAPDAGRIFFDNLYAVLLNINNRDPKENTQLSAQANLLGEGNVNLFVTFPADIKKRATLVGTIKDFSIPKINSMLTPSTNIKVESGEMKKLSFTFTFNAIRSDGEIELNYDDLKLVTFKETDDKKKVEDLEKDNFKTFIMNTFIFRKTMDEDVPEEKRTGTVMFVRDDSRSVFNFWVKSVVSGIKSAYNLDKTEAKKTERDTKKEERLSKREARKLRRAEKKRERG